MSLIFSWARLGLIIVQLQVVEDWKEKATCIGLLESLLLWVHYHNTNHSAHIWGWEKRARPLDGRSCESMSQGGLSTHWEKLRLHLQLVSHTVTQWPGHLSMLLLGGGCWNLCTSSLMMVPTAFLWQPPSSEQPRGRSHHEAKSHHAHNTHYLRNPSQTSPLFSSLGNIFFFPLRTLVLKCEKLWFGDSSARLWFSKRARVKCVESGYWTRFGGTDWGIPKHLSSV